MIGRGHQDLGRASGWDHQCIVRACCSTKSLKARQRSPFVQMRPGAWSLDATASQVWGQQQDRLLVSVITLNVTCLANVSHFLNILTLLCTWAYFLGYLEAGVFSAL